MPTLTIDGKEITVEPGTTIMRACEEMGIEVPHFCYHERLSIAGNCRMCLVEMENSSKPIASCAMPATDGMVIYTDTPEVKSIILYPDKTRFGGKIVDCLRVKAPQTTPAHEPDTEVVEAPVTADRPTPEFPMTVR